MVSLDEILIIISVMLIFYTLLVEVHKHYKQGNWIILLVIGGMLLILGYLIYNNYKETNPETNNPTEGVADESDNDKLDDLEVPDHFNQISKDFGIGPPMSDSPNGINYEQFKNICETPDFINKFTQAIDLSLNLKAKRYRELRKQIKTEIDTLSTGNGINQINPNFRDNQMVGPLKDTLVRIDRILTEINNRTNKLSVEVSQHNLQNALYHPTKGLETLAGRNNVKDFLALRLYTFAFNPRIFFTKFQNIPIYAGSGYGKTKVANVIGHVYSSSGILVTGNFIQTTKAGLVSPYVNETAHNTRRLLLSTLESVLFIDEAYDITPEPNLLRHVDHGQEAITEMVNFIDKMIGLNIIIVAGYEDQMQTRFMEANEGLPRRFLPPIVLSPYNPSELTTILVRFVKTTNPGLNIEQEHGDYMFSLINRLLEENPNVFDKQAGDMENLSSEISSSIYSSPDVIWPNQFERKIIQGFNKFLSRKGISISEK